MCSAHCAPTAPNPDRMIYLVLCEYGSGRAWAERVADRVNLADTIVDIHSGELPNVKQVIEINIAEIISRDVTEDVLKAAGRWTEDAPPLTGQDAIDWQHDHVRGLHHA
jgi:hypothetical protein